MTPENELSQAVLTLSLFCFVVSLFLLIPLGSARGGRGVFVFGLLMVGLPLFGFAPWSMVWSFLGVLVMSTLLLGLVLWPMVQGVVHLMSLTRQSIQRRGGR
jgi:hypothetical protein